MLFYITQNDKNKNHQKSKYKNRNVTYREQAVLGLIIVLFFVMHFFLEKILRVQFTKPRRAERKNAKM